MPFYSLDRVGDPDEATCPIVGLAVDSGRHESDWHTHRRTQLLYLVEGSVALYTGDRLGQLAPTQAAWLPAGMPHRCVMRGAFAYRTLYFDTAVYRGLPAAPAIVDINPLLREAIVRVSGWPDNAALDAPRRRLVAMLLDELAAARTAPLHLPLPRDKRLAAIARALLQQPDLPYSLDEWGDRVGASARTLARGFARETGLSFAQWRVQCRLHIADSLLARGASVTEAAFAAGYASDSAFIAGYRRVYGVTPGSRRKQAGDDAGQPAGRART